MAIGSITMATHTTTSAEQIGAGKHHSSSGIVRSHHNKLHAALGCTTESKKRPHGDAFDGNAKNEELNDVHRFAVTPSPPSVLNENGAGTDLSRHTSNIRKTNKDNNNDADTSHHEDINGVNNKVKHEDDAAPPTIPSSIPSHSHYQHPMYYPPHPTNPMYYPYSDPAHPLNSYYQHPMYPPHPMYPMVYPYSGPPPPLNSYDQHPMYPPHPNHPSGYHWNMLFCPMPCDPPPSSGRVWGYENELSSQYKQPAAKIETPQKLRQQLRHKGIFPTNLTNHGVRRPHLSGTPSPPADTHPATAPLVHVPCYSLDVPKSTPIDCHDAETTTPSGEGEQNDGSAEWVQTLSNDDGSKEWEPSQYKHPATAPLVHVPCYYDAETTTPSGEGEQNDGSAEWVQTLSNDDGSKEWERTLSNCYAIHRKDAPIPQLNELVNFPEYMSNKPCPPDVWRCCVMCGLARPCSKKKVTNSSSGKNSNKNGPIEAGRSLSMSNSTTEDTPDTPRVPVVTCRDSTVRNNNNNIKCIRLSSSSLSMSSIQPPPPPPHIPLTHKGLCNICIENVWIVASSGLEIKWCVGCKRFCSWAAFGNKGLASCFSCREKWAAYKYQKKKNIISSYDLYKLKKVAISEENFFFIFSGV
jgi:hypothetical protein